MMNNKLILGVVVVWLIALTYIQFAPKTPLISDHTGAVIAYVHGDTLRQGMNLISSLEATLRDNMYKLDSLLQYDSSPLQEEAQELIGFANSSNATPSEIETASNRVNEIEQQLQKLQYEAERIFALQESKMQATIAAHLTETLRAFSDDHGIDIVFNWGLSGEGVLYGTDALDVTQEVLIALNKTND
jgi:Skp family chaperone for outer membrane proteins